MLSNFCKSYEEIRKNDIKSDGTDSKAHKNDEALSNVTLNLDEQSLRSIFKSIGLADKDGCFPIKSLIDKSDAIANTNLPSDESVRKQLDLLSSYYPDFATCQNSTLTVLQSIVLNHENLNFNECVVSRVYSKDDDAKKPVIYVYVDLPEKGKTFYFGDDNSKQFLELSQKDFEARFECYEKDIEKNGGNRPWDNDLNPHAPEDLNKSSGKLISSEGSER